MSSAPMLSLAPTSSFADFAAIGFNVGTIIKAEPFPKARNPSYKLTIDFGNLGIKRSSAQLPHTYPVIEEIFNKTVVAVTNFAPRNIAGFQSEVLIVGFPDDQGHVVLLNTRNRLARQGLPLTPGEKTHKQQIPFETFSKIDIKSATITHLQPLEVDPTCYEATLDAGAFGMRSAMITDIDENIAQELLNTQVPVVLNIKRECLHDPNCFVLSFCHEGKFIPLGVDAPVQNGGALF